MYLDFMVDSKLPKFKYSEMREPFFIQIIRQTIPKGVHIIGQSKLTTPCQKTKQIRLKRHTIEYKTQHKGLRLFNTNVILKSSKHVKKTNIIMILSRTRILRNNRINTQICSHKLFGSFFYNYANEMDNIWISSSWVAWPEIKCIIISKSFI